MKKKKRARIWIALLTTIILLFVVIGMERKASKPAKKTKVWQAEKQIEKGLIMMEKDQQTMSIREISVDETIVPVDAILHSEELEGMITRFAISEGQILTEGMFQNKDDSSAKLKHPVEVSVKVEDASQAVGGLIREGDHIRISVVNEVTNEYICLQENVEVTKSIHIDGSPIERNDREKSAVILNFKMEQSEEAAFNQELSMGKLRISRLDE